MVQDSPQAVDTYANELAQLLGSGRFKTDAELAAKIGIARETLSRYRAGKPIGTRGIRSRIDAVCREVFAWTAGDALDEHPAPTATAKPARPRKTLAELRKRLGYSSQHKFGAAIGRSGATVQTWERGTPVPPAAVKDIIRLAGKKGLADEARNLFAPQSQLDRIEHKLDLALGTIGVTTRPDAPLQRDPLEANVRALFERLMARHDSKATEYVERILNAIERRLLSVEPDSAKTGTDP